ncbi:MAG: fused MFS/spermidine synthase [Mariprofundus sp.]|nr:fused MFS/spermidine synthase [Mariprofundus sp.]
MNRSMQAMLLLLLYGLSGLTALAYEVLWTRMLSLLFGISILGVVVTVAAFMLGLGLGSFMGCRWLGSTGNSSIRNTSIKSTLRLLAAIEFGVALYAVCLPYMMQALQGMWLSVDNVVLWQAWQMSSALWVLCVPALALGFAFPCMLRVGKSLQLSLGALYGINTLGGALGALLPLILLPQFGWVLALQIVAAVGVLLAVALLWLSQQVEHAGCSEESGQAMQSMQSEQSEQSEQSKQAGQSKPSIRSSHLLVYGLMGAAALMLEIAWTRAYGMILLRTEYVLAVILAVFLVGIGVGSVGAKYLPRERALQCMPILVAAMALLALYAFPWINGWSQAIVVDSLSMALVVQGLLIALCTLPVTLAMGAWLPLIAQHDEGASLYAANSVGACLGALLAGFVLIPWLGTAATWVLAALLMMLCGFFWQVQTRRVLFASLSLPLFIVVAWPVYHLPAASLLLQAELPSATDLYQREDAVSITHVVQRNDGQRILLADLQRMDASSDPTSVAVQQNQARLPMFLHGNPESVLFLGLGTGITASGALAWPQARLKAVELSQGAIIAAQSYFEQVNAGIAGKIDIQHDDARRFLMRSEAHFDVVVGDLFHPDMQGRGALLSVEQFARVKAVLNEQGLFVQWLAFNQFDKAALQVVLRSFAQVFPHNAVFVDGYRLGLVGFHDHHQNAAYLLANAPADALWGGEGGWTWLGRYWGDVAGLLPENLLPESRLPDDRLGDGLSADNSAVTVQGEWSPKIEFTLPALRYQDSALPDVLLWLIEHRMHLSEAAKRWSVDAAGMQAFKRAWAATAFNVRAQMLTLQGKPGVQRLQALAYRANAKDRWAGFALADAMFASLKHARSQGLTDAQALQKILSIRPDHEGALKAMLELLQQRGDEKAAQDYKHRLFRISPYARVS